MLQIFFFISNKIEILHLLKHERYTDIKVQKEIENTPQLHSFSFAEVRLPFSCIAPG